MKNIKMTAVKSSQILSVGYDPEMKTLYLEFTNGTVYEYYDVPGETYNALLVPTMSVGKYFFAYIKGKLEYMKTAYQVTDGQLIQI